MVSHGERSPGALAHGVAQSSDIQRARRDLGAVAVRMARDAQAEARRRQRAASGPMAARVEPRGR
jgi:hypothetical protein